MLTVSTQLLADGFKVPSAAKWADMEDNFIEDEQNPWEGMGEAISWDLDYNKLEAYEDLEQEDEPEDPSRIRRIQSPRPGGVGSGCSGCMWGLASWGWGHRGITSINLADRSEGTGQ